MKFSSLSQAKIKEAIFNCSQIQKLMMADFLTNIMNETKENAWSAFNEVVHKFLGNVKDPRYKEIVGNVLDKLKVLGCNINLKFR